MSRRIVRRSSATRRTSIPPARQAGGFFGSMFAKLAGASEQLERSRRPMATRLADELMAAYRKEGKAMNTREQTHRMADANKAFAHFAW